MGMRTLYIGETNPKDTKYYYELDKSACNLYTGNYKSAPEEKSTGVFYTGLSELKNDYTILLKICMLFDKIIYRSPAVWTNDLSKQMTDSFLIMLSRQQKFDGWIEDFNVDGVNNFAFQNVSRETQDPQLWVAGCSWSSADGVNKQQRWGDLLANRLNMAVSTLAESGSGISYQAKQTLSADIRENDIVIFQLTTSHRETIFRSKYGLMHVNPSTFEKVPGFYKEYSPNRLDELTLTINQITDIQNVVNFLQKIKAKFLFWNPGAILPMNSVLESFMAGKDYFYLYPDSMIDLGTDNDHPGPKTHKQYADFVFKKFKQQEEQT